MKWLRQSGDEPLFDTLFVFDRDFEADIDDSSDMWTMMDADSQNEVSQHKPHAKFAVTNVRSIHFLLKSAFDATAG
jgi:hypothetical protein